MGWPFGKYYLPQLQPAMPTDVRRALRTRC
jgi:hypothetical protein